MQVWGHAKRLQLPGYWQQLINKMTSRKAAGPSGVADMLKAAGDAGTMCFTEVCS